MSYFIVVFSADNVIEAKQHVEYGDYSLSTKIPSGEYVVVNCEVGRPQANWIGITKVEAINATVSATVELRDLCFLHGGTPPSNVLATPISTGDLTAHQRKATIGVIEDGYRSWWDNAPREVKAALEVAFTREDEARDLMRQGTEFVLNGKFEEAKSLITKGLTMYPEMRSARAHLGRISIEVGRISEAVKWFEDELELAKDPDELSAHLYLEAIYEAMGNMGQAGAHAQAAMSTESYRITPAALAPEVVQKIREVALSSTASNAARQDQDHCTNTETTVTDSNSFINLPENIKREIETILLSDQPTMEAAIANLVERYKKADPEISYLVTVFIKGLGDEDYHIRGAAAYGLKSLALNEIKDMGAVESLIAALKDEEPSVRVEAAWTLQYLHDSRAVEPLIEALKDELGRVRSHAAEALGNIKDTRAVIPLIEALGEDKSMEVRDVAARSLWKIRDARAIEPLIGALNDDYVRTTARIALENLTGENFGSDISKWPEWWAQNRSIQSSMASKGVGRDQDRAIDPEPTVTTPKRKD